MLPSIQLSSLIAPNSLIVQYQCNVGGFLHSHKCVVDIFSLSSRCCQNPIALSLAKLVCTHSCIMRQHPRVYFARGTGDMVLYLPVIIIEHLEKIRGQSSTLKCSNIVGINLFLMLIKAINVTSILIGIDHDGRIGCMLCGGAMENNMGY